jgi:hypothetical protein
MGFGVANIRRHGPGLETLMAPPLHRGPRALKGTSTAENFRKGGVHGVGTVVFTVSAQFGVPVPYIWALTSGITSYTREIVASLAEVERLSSRSSRQSPSRSGEQETKGPLWVRSRRALGRCECPLSQ